VILEALGIITIHNLTIMPRTDEASGVRGSLRQRLQPASRNSWIPEHARVHAWLPIVTSDVPKARAFPADVAPSMIVKSCRCS
jgi:hypothetical protein